MTNKINIPQIRFSSFTDAWEQRELSELLTQRIEHQTITEEAPLLAFSYAEGVINPEDKKSNKRDFIMLDKYNKIFSRTEKDDIIYNPANVIHGAVHRNKLKSGVVSPIYKIFMCNDGVSPKYIGERLHTDKFLAEIVKYIEGTVIKLRTLSPEQFLKMKIEIPIAFEEQELIGSSFEHIDNLITLQQRKYDKLLLVKKSMLEKMFPQKGESVPRIRFAGFTDAWEQRKLFELGEIMTGSTPSTSKSEYYSADGIPWVTPTDIDAQTIFDTPRRLSEEGMKVGRVVPANTILCTCIASIGKNTLLTVKGSFNQQINSLTPNENNDAYFLLTESEIWSNTMKRMAAAGTMQIVNKTEFSELLTMVPELAEQKKIGEYFRNIDNLITLHQRKLDKLKNIKKSMLEKMFV